MNSFFNKSAVKYMLLAAALVLVVIFFVPIIGATQTLLHIAFPLLLGFVIAYVLNILVSKIEKLYFPKSKSKVVAKSRKPVAFFLSIALIALLIVFVVMLVVPEIARTISLISTSLPAFIDEVNVWLTANRDSIPFIGESVGEISFNLSDTLKNMADYVSSNFADFFGSSLGVVKNIAGAVFSIVVALVFAVYLLFSKEKLLGQLKRVQGAYMKKSHAESVNTVLAVANESFGGFISGQVVEAVILGVLCTLGMWIFRLPYALTIGVFIGVTALVPLVGAYIGAGIGAFLIFMVDPMKAVVFLIFILILQQLENNLIYPRIVGTSIGLPGIWVLAAVVIGGGLGGIVGMLIGVPLAATVYKLMQMSVRNKLRNATTEG